MTPSFSRLDRIGDMLKRELAVLIPRHLVETRAWVMSVTRVVVSRDLMHAKVYVSMLLAPEKIPMAIDTLNQAASQLRYLTAQRIVLRVMPELKFYYDDTLVRGNRMS